MTTRTIVPILILVLAVLLNNSCATWSTPLHRAASRDDLLKVNRLIEEGADVNAKGKWGDTALMAASQMGYKDIVKLLKEAGAEE